MTALVVIAVGVVAFSAGYVLRRLVAEAKIRSAEEQARRILDDANREADAQRKESLLEAKEEALRVKREVEREIREQRADIQRLERRLVQREEALDRKTEQIERRERAIQQQEQELAQRAEEITALIAEQRRTLERISGLTSDQAREELLQQIEAEAREDALARIRKIEQETREEAERRARDVLALAIQRTAADHTTEVTVSVVPLPTDEMKGRIIGREGRNIRALEALTGVDVIIDDTPEAVALSSFDPVRREVAKIALEKLMADGRIHPARIEETVERAQRELDERIAEEGERAAFEAGVHGLHPDLVKLLGRLKFRTSYGQNILQHSVEVALLAGELALQIGADAALARRCGLLHDIGKALTHEVQGTHTEIGADLARRYHEHPAVINAIFYHHGEEEAKYVEAVLTAAADSISGARPGARKESVEMYIKRLQNLEHLAGSFPGVEKAYAIQAGREIRVIVRPNEIDDLTAYRLAQDMARRIESELEYPGQIKVTVLRETRIVEYAR
ncbi:MAG: ribonuclease Y [Armatimonadota bacterium]|nr:ribonuclease Y [Armatimonadota bacterium]